MSLRGEGSRDNVGYWDPGSGRVERGEKTIDAVGREVLEEYSTQPLSVTFLGVRENITIDGHWISFDYIVLINRVLVKNNEPKKFERVDWFTYKELAELKSHPLFPQFLELHKNEINLLIQDTQ